MAMRDVRNRDSGPTSASACRVGFGRSLRIIGIGGIFSVAIDAVRYLQPVLVGEQATWAHNGGRSLHIPILVVCGVLCLGLGTLLAGLWLARVIESIELHFLGER